MPRIYMDFKLIAETETQLETINVLVKQDYETHYVMNDCIFLTSNQTKQRIQRYRDEMEQERYCAEEGHYLLSYIEAENNEQD